MQWSLLESLGAEERRQVLAAARRRRFGRREVIFHRGDPGDTVHLISSGTVAVYVATPTGSTTMFAVLGPGEAVGEMALVEAGERTATAIAIEAAETLSLRRDQFEALRLRHPAIDRALVVLLAARVRRLNAELLDAYLVNAEKRVVRRLLQLAERASDGDDGVRTVRFTQGELAALAGTTRPTANKVLRDLERAGTVALARGRIGVTSVEELARRAR